MGYFFRGEWLVVSIPNLLAFKLPSPPTAFPHPFKIDVQSSTPVM
jgi:hypothetical protein